MGWHARKSLRRDSHGREPGGNVLMMFSTMAVPSIPKSHRSARRRMRLREGDSLCGQGGGPPWVGTGCNVWCWNRWVAPSASVRGPRTDAKAAAMIKHSVLPIHSAVRSTKMGLPLTVMGRKYPARESVPSAASRLS